MTPPTYGIAMFLMLATAGAAFAQWPGPPAPTAACDPGRDYNCNPRKSKDNTSDATAACDPRDYNCNPRKSNDNTTEATATTTKAARLQNEAPPPRRLNEPEQPEQTLSHPIEPEGPIISHTP